MRALDIVLEAQNNTVSPPIYSERLEPFPENPEEALALDPLPPTAAGRKVIIAQKSKPATTSGTGGGLHSWNLTFKQQERWSNPLMGWTSTADPMSNVQLSFSTIEQAIKFCKKRGWKYEVKAPAKREAVFGKFAYSHNFLPHMVEHDLKINGTKTQHFAFPTAGASHYERPLNFVGTGSEVVAASDWYPVDKGHQDYYNRNKSSNGYCRLVIHPKLSKVKHDKFKSPGIVSKVMGALHS
eukprot:g3291.t1